MPQVPSRDFYVAVVAQRACAQLGLGNLLKPGAVQMIGLNAAHRRDGAVKKAPEHLPRHSHHAPVFADLDDKLDGLVLFIPAGVMRESEEDLP